MFCLDIETLGHTESSVVASAALLYFDLESKCSYEELLQQTVFVKFDIKEQIKSGRVLDKETIEWWKKQAKIVREYSIQPSDNDVSAEEGINILSEYAKEKLGGKEDIVWSRGSLDQFCIDHLFRQNKKEPLFPYAWYRDMRTAIDILRDTSKRGYCDVPNFDKNKVWKHIPTHDVCWDVLMLRDGV